YDMNLYHLSEAEKAKLTQLPTRLEDALDALENDYEFLTAGGVFPEHLIKNFIALKRKECLEMSKIPHPAEFDKYFNL
ncbi:MAG: glutamine synthetase, partial [Longicatena sp.]|nr:glutamine synthetase [Longicatena sp.]